METISSLEQSRDRRTKNKIYIYKKKKSDNWSEKLIRESY